jgi:hypothetical protein
MSGGSVLIGHDPDDVMVLSEAQHRFDEIVAVSANYPRRSNDGMPCAGRANRHLSVSFGTPVNALGSNRVSLVPSARFLARKYVVRGNMNYRYARAVSGGRQKPRCHGVYGISKVGFALGSVNGRVGAAIDDRSNTLLSDDGQEVRRLGKIQLRATRGEYLDPERKVSL